MKKIEGFIRFGVLVLMMFLAAGWTFGQEKKASEKKGKAKTTTQAKKGEGAVSGERAAGPINHEAGLVTSAEVQKEAREIKEIVEESKAASAALAPARLPAPVTPPIMKYQLPAVPTRYPTVPAEAEGYQVPETMPKEVEDAINSVKVVQGYKKTGGGTRVAKEEGEGERKKAEKEE